MRRNVSQGQRAPRHPVARLTLWINVGGPPSLESLRTRILAETRRSTSRPFRGRDQQSVRRRRTPLLESGGELGPSGIGGELGSFLQHQPPKLLKAHARNQELQPGAGPVLLLSQAREDTANGLGHGEELFFRQERIEKLRLVRHRAQSTPHVELEPATRFTVLGSGASDVAQVMKRSETAGLILATGEGDLELPAELLSIGMAEQEVAARLGVRRDVEGLVAAYAGQRTG